MEVRGASGLNTTGGGHVLSFPAPFFFGPTLNLVLLFDLPLW